MKIFSTIVFFVFLVSVGYAQPNKNSPVFDPDCYFPDIDNPTQIDTIYGAKGGQSMGNYVWNDGKGRMYINGMNPKGKLYDSDTYYAYETGSSFSLHSLTSIATGVTYRNMVLGHFRDKNNVDGYTDFGGLLWTNIEGYFDTSRASYLFTGSGYSSLSQNVYHAYLSSDTVEDHIAIVSKKFNTDPLDRRQMIAVAYWKGGDSLYQVSKLNNSLYYSDDLVVIDTIESDSMGRITFAQGDFRGTGRDDLILHIHYPKRHFLLTFYKNDPPFTLKKFADAILHDTLMTSWENPSIRVDSTSQYSPLKMEDALTMRAMYKPSWDKSYDFIIKISTDTSYSAHIFKGGPEFGSKRLTLPSDFAIPSPAYIDMQSFYGMGWEGGMYDCGDMTGTGNRVLLLKRDGSTLFNARLLFFVTGKALDTKADMYYEGNEFNRSVVYYDTLTANNDDLQDFLIGFPEFAFPKDNTSSKGTLHLLYGSDKIPVKIDPKWAVQNTNKEIQEPLLFPNPVVRTALLKPNISSPNGRYDILIYNILGEVVYKRNFLMESDAQVMIDLTLLHSGTYVLVVRSGSAESRKSFLKVN